MRISDWSSDVCSSDLYFRRSTEARLLPDQVGRQGQITHLAFRLLGREKAIAFLNAHHASLGARPLDLATANAAGYVTVESAIRQMAPTCRPRSAERRVGKGCVSPCRSRG